MDTMVVVAKSKRAVRRLGKLPVEVIVEKRLPNPIEINGRTYNQPMLMRCGLWWGWMCGVLDINEVGVSN